jgi:hypothetical protein
MSLRANLARNLRNLCRQRGSINTVCREMGIHRSQFEKYLGQVVMPSPASLKKICAYFQISEQELFSDTAAAIRSAGSVSALNGMDASCADVLSPLWTEGSASIKPGIYFLWITVPKDPDHIVCAPLFIVRRGEALTFRRIVGAGEPRDKLWFHRVGDHKGLVVERLNWIMLVGINQRGTHEPSLMRLKWTSLSQPTLSGHATITTESGISFSALCMRPAPPGTTFRRAVRQSRSYHRDDAMVDATIRLVLDQERRDLAMTLGRDLAL